MIEYFSKLKIFFIKNKFLKKFVKFKL